MKNLNLIKRLWTDSHEKQSLQRFARYAAMLIMLLTLGVGQMWAAISYSGGYIYFDNSLGINSTTLQLCARQDKGGGSYWTAVSSLTNISNTKLYYVANPQGSRWSGIIGWVVISANPAKSSSDFDNWSSYTWCSNWNTYGFNSGSTYLIVPSSTSKSQSVTTTYYSGGYSALNSTQTINTVVKTGSGSYTSANSKATISITSYAMTGNGAVTKQTTSISTSAKTQTVSAARTATTTYTVGDVASGYQFDGWYTAATGGTQLSSSKTYTYYPTAATTVYARFSEKMSTVTLTASPSGKGSFTIGGAAATNTTAGVTTTRSVTAVPISGYHFVSWSITGGASISSTTTNPTTVTGGGAGTAATLTATFEADAVNSLTVEAGTHVTTVTGSTSPVTLGNKYAINATAFETGWQFLNWTATPAANGTFDNASSASTNVTVKNGSVVVTANAREKMTTVTVNVSPSGAGTLTLDASAFTPGNTTTAGVATSHTVVATALNSDYTFNNWSVTSNATGTASTNTYTLKGNGSAGTGTLTANFNLVACNLLYGSSTPLNSSTDGGAMSYDNTEEAYYIDVTTNSSPYYFRFDYNTNSEQYSGNWTSYPNVVEAVANGSKVDCNQTVKNWENKTSIKFTGANGSSIRIWFDYQNKKAWITEPGYSVTINNGDHGTVSPNGVRSVGASGLTITATPAEGYKFASWSVTDGAHVASSTSATTTLTATADGTVTAIYETESPIRLYYSNPAGWSNVYAYLWDVDNTSDKNANWPGTDITTNIELVDCQQYYYYEFYPSAHAGWDRIIFNGGDGSKQTGNITFSAATNAGQYNNAGKDATGSWQNPTNSWYFAYDGDSWSTTAHPLTCTSVTSGYVELDLAANTDYAFKFVENGSTWYGCTTATKITYENKATAQTMNNTAGGSADQTIKTASAGTYRFTWDITNKRVTVTYPDSYKITFGMGTGGATITASATSAGGSFSSGDYVGSGADVTFTQTASTGYTFAGWYTTKDAGGSVVSGMGISDNVLENVTTNKTVWSRYTENMTSVSLVASPTGKGTFQIGGATVTSTSAGVTTNPAVTAVPATGYSVNTSSTVWATNNANITLNNVKANPVTVTGAGSVSTSTLTATFTPNNYTITLHEQGATTHGTPGDGGTITATYDANTNLSTITALPERTGYTFDGYYDTPACDGTWIIKTDRYFNWDGTYLNSSTGVWKYDGNVDLYAKWTAIRYTVTLDVDEANKGTTASATTSQNIYYDDATVTVPNRPTAAEGYKFDGYYTEQLGAGTKVINGDGTWIASVTGYTDASKHWIHADDVKLYAYYKKAEITALTLDATVVETNAPVGVTPTISPAPEGTTKLCFYVFYGNDNPLDPQPFISWNGTKATFNAGETSGTYKIGVSLRTGTECGGGTLLDSTTISYQVAGTHTVTVRYKCGDEVIKAASSLEGIRPLDWSDEITAPDIIGYSFTGWSAGDGVSLTDDDGAHTKTSTTEADIKIKAVYDGYLTANYSKKRIIYFNNTLNWDTVVVYFYKNSSYWGNTQGSGANTTYTFTNTPYSEGKHGGMKRVAPGSNIWYFDAEAAGVNASYQTVVFTDKDQHGCNYFYNNVKVIKRDDYYSTKLPMFVPVASQTPDAMNSNTANYYNKGYWMNYPENTGYTLKIYNKKETDGATELKSIPFNFTENKTMPMELDVDLEAGLTYGFKIYRNDGQNDGAGSFFGNTGTMTANTEGWDMTTEASSNTGLQTTAAGSYKFILNYYAVSSTYHYRVSVTYPVTTGDYRLLYKDDVHTLWHPSAVIPKASAKDTVSFFVRKGQAAILKLQKCTGLGAGTVTWTDTVTWWNGSNLPSAITQDSVYNLCLKHNASTGKLEIENIEAYTGNYYIRVDAANSKWDNYRTDPDHLMTYSEYSITHGGYSHYYTHWVQTDDRKNIKFTIANDYSPCISDTLARETASGDWANITNYVESNGDLKRNANVRFMWNRHDNTIKRAYVDGAQEDGSEFLLMLNTDSPNRIRWADESALTSNKVTFSDNGNWIYEANIQAKPNAQIKLKSTWGTRGTAIVQYFKGSSSTSEDLVGGSGDTWYDIRVIYDFKTNRLVASYIPRGKIDDEIEINADVMFIREHQGDIAQLTFGEKGAIKKIETAYGVLRFNKWTLNNKEKTGTHEPLASPKSRYERDLFYVSFPFRVSMEEVFGFGTYGTHWIIEYYDGAGRATNGYWLESGPNWKFIWDRKNQFFEPNQGYIIALELDELGESSSVWANTEQVELYFPSYGTMPDITKASVNCTIPEHTCTINRSGGALGPEYDRRVKDSHWNVISVPTYVNTNNPTFANTDWITTADETHVGPNFLYEWNPDDNSVTARSGIGYNYQAMHAYLVQYCGAITWTSSVSPAAAPRRNPAYRGEYEFCLEMMQNDQVVDQTYVKLSDDEHVTTGFEFNYDMSKEFNKSKANIYTLIGTEPVAGNVLPMTDQTTVVPVGVKIATTGDYTFAIPEGTAGVGVTLIDNETGIRTSLSALDYTINLSAGTYENRFVLEISPIKPVATGVEQSQMTNHQSQIKKVLVDGLLYIVKDGKVFDAHGNRVK